MACPKCRVRRTVEIAVSLAGRMVTLHSCSNCDTRWWDDEEGSVINLRDVIDMATVRR